MKADNLNIAKLVRPDEGLIHRSIYNDQDTYQAELTQIFARC